MEPAPSPLGLSMRHISPQHTAGRAPAGAPAAVAAPTGEVVSPFRVEVAAGATLVRLRGPGSGRAPDNGGGRRGQVCGFSRKSRKRLLDELNSVPVDVLADALFVTLTVSDVALEKWQEKRAKRGSYDGWALAVPESKRALDRFVKRLRRAWPKCSGVWRMERVPRLSGAFVGELVPHYHVLVFNVPWMEYGWLASAWYECVGSGDERHLRAGTSVQRVRSRRGALSYAAKYMTKEEWASDAHTGRMWAQFGNAWLQVLIRTYELTARQFYRLRRCLRSYVLKSWRGGGAVRGRWARAPGQGCTAYLSEPAALRLLAWAAEPM